VHGIKAAVFKLTDREKQTHYYIPKRLMCLHTYTRKKEERKKVRKKT